MVESSFTDNWYYIRTELSDMVVDVCNANRANGAAVHMYPKNGTDAQKWHLTPDGFLESKLNYKVIDIPAHNRGVVHMWERHGRDHQIWHYTRDGYLENPAGVVLEIPGGNRERNVRVGVNSKLGGLNQKWKFTLN